MAIGPRQLALSSTDEWERVDTIDKMVEAYLRAHFVPGQAIAFKVPVLWGTITKKELDEVIRRYLSPEYGWSRVSFIIEGEGEAASIKFVP
jgi:hypothetical protein